MERVEHTLHKGFIKNDLHLLLCEDNIWNNWCQIINSYAQGGFPNTKGDISTPTIEDQRKRKPTLKRGKIQQASRIVTLGPTFHVYCGARIKRSYFFSRGYSSKKHSP